MIKYRWKKKNISFFNRKDYISIIDLPFFFLIIIRIKLELIRINKWYY